MLALPQELTHAQAPAHLARLTAALPKQDAKAVVIDCSALVRFDSSALSVLLGMNRAAQAVDRRIVLRACPDRLRQLAEVYGVLGLFHFEAAGEVGA